MAQIDGFFKLMNDEGASDLHMVAGQQPLLRIRGDMERVKFKKMDNDELRAMLVTKSRGLPDIDVTFFNKNMVSEQFFVKFPAKL